MAIKIFIDAGHGGINEPGAVNGSRLEKNDNLKFALALEKRLKENGFETRQSRTFDTAVSLENRALAANNWPADLFISIHRNSFANSSANGVECWVFTSVDQQTKNIANSIYNEIIGIYAQSKRGVKSGNLHVLRETRMPAILLEMGFISNTIDNEMFDKHFDTYVEAVTKAVCKEFGVNYRPPDSSGLAPPTGKLWRVQVGAFSVKVNAENMLKRAINAGFSDSFIVETIT